MAIKRFLTKAEALYLNKQTTEGTYDAPAASDAVYSLITPDLEPTFDVGDAEYISGDPTIVEGFSYTKDSYVGGLKRECFVRVLKNGLDTTATVDDSPEAISLEASAFELVVLATTKFGFTAGSVIARNTGNTDVILSADYRKVSIDDATNDKVWKYKDLRATVDLSVVSQEPPKFTFNFKGELEGEEPIAAAHISPQFPPNNYLASIRKNTIIEAWAYPSTIVQEAIGSSSTMTIKAVNHGISSGNSIRLTGVSSDDTNFAMAEGIFTVATIIDTDHFTVPTGAFSGTVTGNLVILNLTAKKPVCFNKLEAPNLGGHELQRVITACSSGFVRGKVIPEVMLTIEEDQAGGTNFDPDANRMNFFGLELKFGLGVGKYLTILFNNLQIKDVKKGDISIRKGREVTFRNYRHVYLVWR
jgi:hypothetical protein